MSIIHHLTTAGLLLLLVACSSKDNSSHQPDRSKPEAVMQSKPIASVLSPAEFIAKLKNAGETAQLVDIRTPDELKETGFIAGAKNIDYYADDFEQNMKQLDKSKPLFLYCARGGRSGEATAQMSVLGFKEVYDLQGGMTLWLKESRPVEK